MSSTEKSEKGYKLFHSTNKTDWSNHHTVTGPTASRLGDVFVKDSLHPVLEHHHDNHDSPFAQSSSYSPNTFSNKSVFRKNFFSKRETTFPNQKTLKSSGKVKNLFSSIRQRSKSTSIDTSSSNASTSISVDASEYEDDNVFNIVKTDNIEESLKKLKLSDGQLQNDEEIGCNAFKMDIGPDQYISYHRDRTQSDATKFLIARKEARDKAKYSPFAKTLPSRHHSTYLEDEDVCMDPRLLIWKDPKKGTRIYRMPSNSQRLTDSDDLMHPDQVYIKLLDKHTCYDIMPSSSKIVVFDSRLTIKKAFLALAKDGVKAAILWDNQLQTFTGMLTITDFIQILYKYYTESTHKPEELENDYISKWRELLNCRDMVFCSPEDTVLKALNQLCENRVHRLLVLDKRLGNPINVLTHKRILAFIHHNITSMDIPTFVYDPITSFPHITVANVTTITFETKLIQVLKFFIEKRISAVPVVDQQNRLVTIFAKFDFSKLAYDHLYSNLDRPVRDVLNTVDESRINMHTVPPHIPLIQAINKIVKASVHRLVLVDEDRKVVGIATLSDLLRCLVMKSEKADVNEERC